MSARSSARSRPCVKEAGFEVMDQISRYTAWAMQKIEGHHEGTTADEILSDVMADRISVSMRSTDTPKEWNINGETVDSW